MTALARFGVTVPHVPLLDGVTPVETIEVAGVRLTIKRDDLTSSVYGGNKVRKLEFLLGEAKHLGRASLLTTGAYGSHHVLATATHGTRAGFEVHAVVVPQPLTDHVRENIRADLATGATLHAVRNALLVPPQMKLVETKLRLRGRRAHVFGHGGSTAVGTLGYVCAGLELADQVERGECEEPRAIYLPLGSGATCAGLAIGLAAAGLTTRVIGVRATPRIAANTIVLRHLVRGAMKILRANSKTFPRVTKNALALLTIDGNQFGRGYGVATPASARALAIAKEHGLALDPTYTSKAFAAALARNAPALVLHTLNSANLEERIRDVQLPAWAGR